MGAERRGDLDGLRALATGAVFLFHCAKHFDQDGWHLSNRPTTLPFTAAVVGVSLWLMPLFFLLSGASTRLALGARGIGRLLQDRVLRLLLPFAFGVLVIVPPQVWVERLGAGEFQGSFWAFYPRYFEGWYAFGGNFAWMGLHLWYLLLLFLLTLILAPLLSWLVRGGGQGLRERVEQGLASPLGLLGPLALTWAVEVAIAGTVHDFRGLGGWWPGQYLLYFLVGLLLASSAVRARLRSLAAPALLLGIAAMLVYAGTRFLSEAEIAMVPRPLWRLIRALGSWGVLYGVLGLGDRWLGDRSWTARLNEASMPFYILHQTVILLFAWALLPWALAPALKYLCLVASAFPTTALLTWAVLRIWPLRPLFGLRLPRSGP